MKYLSFFTILASLLFQNYAMAAAPASEQANASLTGVALGEYVQRYENHTFLDSTFLNGYSVFGVLDLSRLTKVTRLGPHFLSNQIGITKVIFPPNVNAVGENFLNGCTGLTKVDLPPLKSFTALETIDLSPLATCPPASEQANASLTGVALEEYVQLMSLDSSFIYSSGNLVFQSCATAAAPASEQAKASLTGAALEEYVQRYENHTFLDYTFLNGYSVSGVLNLSRLTKVTHLYDFFLSKQSGITEIILPPNVVIIETSFLSGCTGLTTIDLLPLKAATKVSYLFLHDCTGLKTVIVPSTPAFKNVQFYHKNTEIQTDLIIRNDGSLEFTNPFVSHIMSIVYNKHIVSIDLQGLSNVRKICPGFLDGCFRLRGVNLLPLKKVNDIGDGFLSGCRSLESLSL
ncbi:MAG: hypothetical protein NEHIOOID_00231 [Holosporales bacterium]